MKKTILLMLFLILFSNISHAQDDKRWLNIYKDDTSEFFLDLETISAYTYGKNVYIGCWIKLRIEDKFIIQKFYFNVETLRYLREKCFLYDKNGDIVTKEDYINKGWQEPIPASNLEYSLKTISIIVGNNMENLKVNVDMVGPHE